jgi:hypothetical protein
MLKIHAPLKSDKKNGRFIQKANIHVSYKVLQKVKTHFMFISLFSESFAVCEIIFSGCAA